MNAEYSVRDLFFTTLTDLKNRPRIHAQVCALYQAWREVPAESIEAGAMLIRILKLLRRRPALVDQINEAQAVDIFNELDRTLLSQPFYFLPELGSDVLTPDDHLARTTFDQFIYADKEFSLFVRAAWQKQPEAELRNLLCRVTACLYMRKYREFDPENVDQDADVYMRKLHTWELQLIQFAYGHTREAVMNRCPTLFSKVGNAGKEPQSTGPMWAKLKHEVARTGVFGTFHEVGRARLYDVLDHLEILSKEVNQRAHAAA